MGKALFVREKEKNNTCQKSHTSLVIDNYDYDVSLSV